MDQRWKYPFAVMTLAAVLASGTAIPSYVHADDNSEKAAVEEVVAGELPSIGSVSIGGSNTIELKQASLSNEESGKIVTFTLTVNNQGSSEIQFIDYWVRLKSSTGTTFPVALFAADKDKNRIPAKSSMDFRFSAKVNDQTNLKDLTFNLIQWDFTRSDFEKPIGTISIPDSYSLLTSVGTKRMASIGNEPIKNGVKRLSVSMNDTHFLPTIYFEMENTGSRGAKLPALQFNLRTAEGLLYPLTASGIDKDTTINPRVTKEVTLTGSIPISVDENGWQLQVTQLIDLGDGTTVQVPVAEFILPDSSKEEVSLGSTYEVSNEDGTYNVRLDELKRLPWEDEDLLAAQVVISNPGTKSLPIPNLTGYFKLDDAVEVDSTVIRGDKVIGLQPGQEITVQYLGKIPYTYDFSSIKLYMQEQKDSAPKEPNPGTPGGGNEGGGKVEDLIQFVHNADMMIVPAVGSGQKQAIHDVGRKAQYSVKEVHTFTGKSGNVMVAMVEIENLEKRFNDISKLVAHYVAPNGTVYTANISEIKSSITPGGKALLHLSGVLPQEVKTNDLQLFIGQAVKEGKLAGKEDTPDAYIQPLAFALPLEKTKPQDDLRNIEFFPYSLSMSNIGTTMNFLTGDLKFSFDYELGKDILVVSNTEDHKMVVEIADNDGKFKRSQEFSLDSAEEGDKGEQPGGGTSLKLGSHEAVLNFNDPELVYKLESLEKYTLNVYYQFQPGQRKLIASKELKWFYTAD
ncbi:hypothetical protein [Paenibacillus sp. J2TS4]|uniref:hypothetical protein n=1 Tax=Paenibacillus sp. J2TS4 TaxID=2807194 RepID=UPI001AFDBC5C|nr:hypothetical protein [Paenibacillus sp. J2TS4]GIP36156.1 hypothetical protein J2TS4_53660 [Paenibacillus sp. J2TS4]